VSCRSSGCSCAAGAAIPAVRSPGRCGCQARRPVGHCCQAASAPFVSGANRWWNISRGPRCVRCRPTTSPGPAPRSGNRRPGPAVLSGGRAGGETPAGLVRDDHRLLAVACAVHGSDAAFARLHSLRPKNHELIPGPVAIASQAPVPGSPAGPFPARSRTSASWSVFLSCFGFVSVRLPGFRLRADRVPRGAGRVGGKGRRGGVGVPQCSAA
jgi:hypothetical protein